MFDHNFLPSSQRERLSVMCDEGTAALHSVANLATLSLDLATFQTP